MDYGTDSDVIGKQCGDDFYDGKITMPVILACRIAQQKSVISGPAPWPAAISRGRFTDGPRILSRHHAVERALTHAKLKQRLLLPPLPPPEKQKKICWHRRLYRARALLPNGLIKPDYRSLFQAFKIVSFPAFRHLTSSQKWHPFGRYRYRPIFAC